MAYEKYFRAQYILLALLWLTNESKPWFLVILNHWFGKIQTSQSTARTSLWILVILVIDIEIPFSTYFLVTWQV